MTTTYSYGGGDNSPTDKKGRPTGFTVGPDGGSPDYTVGYDYDGLGRLNKVTGPGLDTTYGAVYDRLLEDNVNTSDMVQFVKFKSSGGPVWGQDPFGVRAHLVNRFDVEPGWR